MLDQQIGDTFDRKRTYLPDVGGVVEHAGSNGLIELKRLIDELERGYQHIVKGSRFAPQIKYPPTQPLLQFGSGAPSTSAHQIDRGPYLEQGISRGRDPIQAGDWVEDGPLLLVGV